MDPVDKKRVQHGGAKHSDISSQGDALHHIPADITKLASQEFIKFCKLDLALHLVTVPARTNPLQRDDLRNIRVEILCAEVSKALAKGSPDFDYYQMYAEAFPKLAKIAALEVKAKRLPADIYGLPSWMSQDLNPKFIQEIDRIDLGLGRRMMERFRFDLELREHIPEFKLYFDKVYGVFLESASADLAGYIGQYPKASIDGGLAIANDHIRPFHHMLSEQDGLLEALSLAGNFVERR